MATSITRRQIREGAAQDLGIFVPAVADYVNTSDFTVRIADALTKFPDEYHLMDAWLMGRESNDLGNTFYRVVKAWFNETKDTVQLASAPDFAATDDIGIYFLLSPEDWNNALNETLSELYKKVRVTITLTDGDNEYPIDDLTDEEGDDCTWLQSRTQIYGVEVRTASGNIVDLQQWGGVRFIEDNNSLTVHFTYLPATATGLTCVLVGRKPYAWRGEGATGHLLSDDDDTTTCPYKLARYGLQVQVLNLLYKRHGGEMMRARFGGSRNVAMQQFAQAKHQFVPAMQPQTYEVDETFIADLPSEMQTWGW